MSEGSVRLWIVAILSVCIVLVCIIAHFTITDIEYIRNGYIQAMLPGNSTAHWVKP